MESSKLLLAGLGLAILLACGASCKPEEEYEVIPGKLTLLVQGGTDNDSPNASFPCWSSDGSVIYYILSFEPTGWNIGTVWSINVSDSTKKEISDDEMDMIDISPEGNLCAFYDFTNEWIRIMETETWTQIDSIKPTENALRKKAGYMWALRFSYEYSDSNRVLYYLYASHDAGTPLNRVDLGDLSDEKIIENCHSSHLAPGPGDTLFAFDKTIFNLNTGEEAALEVYGGSFDWNPANPRELLVAGGIEKEVYICDLDGNKIRRFAVNNEGVWNARYSPDGKRIAVESRLQISEGGLDWGSIWIFEPE